MPALLPRDLGCAQGTAAWSQVWAASACLCVRVSMMPALEGQALRLGQSLEGAKGGGVDALPCRYTHDRPAYLGSPAAQPSHKDQQVPASGGEEGGHGMGVVGERRKPA